MLAAELAPRELERALDEAIALRLTTVEQVARALAQHAGMRGARVLSALLAERPVANRSRSEGQERMLQVIRDAGLPDPEGDADIGGGFTLDFLWRRERVGAEFDSARWHSTKWARKRDARKDAYCAAQGISLVRATWDDLEAPAVLYLVARLAGLIALSDRAA